MHPNAERVCDALRAAGCDAEVVQLDVPAPTAATAAAALGTTADRIANSLVFVAGDDPILVLTSGANRVDLKRVGELLGAKVRRADPETVRTATGFPIGGVPPLGHATPLRVLVDRDLLAHETVWAAAGTPHAVFEVPPAELLRVTGGTPADVRVEPAAGG